MPGEYGIESALATQAAPIYDILVRASAPDLVSLLILGSLSLILLATGYRLFSRASYRFVEQI